jgi:hypothetical protein
MVCVVSLDVYGGRTIEDQVLEARNDASSCRETRYKRRSVDLQVDVYIYRRVS